MINKQILKLFRITNEDYLNWCKEQKTKSYLKEAKVEFFKYLLDTFLN